VPVGEDVESPKPAVMVLELPAPVAPPGMLVADIVLDEVVFTRVGF